MKVNPLFEDGRCGAMLGRGVQNRAARDRLTSIHSVRLVPSQPQSAGGTFGTDYLFHGMRFDPGTGLHHTPNREHGTSLRRWVRQDAAGYVDGNNLFQFVSGDPTGITDPTGLAGGSTTVPASMPSSGPATAPATGPTTGSSTRPTTGPSHGNIDVPPLSVPGNLVVGQFGAASYYSMVVTWKYGEGSAIGGRTGNIIQHVVERGEVRDGPFGSDAPLDAAKTAKLTHDFYEQWSIDANGIYVIDLQGDRSDSLGRDTWSLARADVDLDNTSGTDTITGTANFFPGDGKPVFRRHEDEMSHDVPSVKKLPTTITWSTEGSVTRTLVFKWCLVGPKRNQFMWVKTSNPDVQAGIKGSDTVSDRDVTPERNMPDPTRGAATTKPASP
jgi:RHS repeat-associated protein